MGERWGGHLPPIKMWHVLHKLSCNIHFDMINNVSKKFGCYKKSISFFKIAEMLAKFWFREIAKISSKFRFSFFFQNSRETSRKTKLIFSRTFCEITKTKIFAATLIPGACSLTDERCKLEKRAYFGKKLGSLQFRIQKTYFKFEENNFFKISRELLSRSCLFWPDPKKKQAAPAHLFVNFVYFYY